MNRTETLAFLNSLPHPDTVVNFTYYDFSGERCHNSAAVKHASDGVYMMGAFGCGKIRDNVRDALIAYLGGRELIMHHHHN